MHPDAITPVLTEIFGSGVQSLESESWQIDTPEFRLLVLLSEDHAWLRALIPVAPLSEVAAILPEILEANFDLTQEARYALYEGVLWGVFHHGLDGLDAEDLSAALARLVVLRQKGLAECYASQIEKRLRQIIQVAKQQGQSLQATLQSLNRLYQEGVMGDLSESQQSVEEVLAVWRQQLARLWPEVDPQPPSP